MRLKRVAAAVLLIACFTEAGELDDAPDELVRAAEAVDQGRLKDARVLLARVQAFGYRSEWMAAALYYEALADSKSGGSTARVSALDELAAFYPDSSWARRAADELKNVSSVE